MAAKKLSKPVIAAIVIVSVLVVAFSVFLPLYLKNNSENRKLYKEHKIKITAYGKEIGAYSLNDFLALSGVAERDFEATYDTSNSDAVRKTYTGIEVKKILLALNVDMASARAITFNGSDGMSKLYTPDDVIANDNVFIAYKVNGKPFNKGIKTQAYKEAEEDGGPFVIIKVSDTFSQHRCKLLVEIEVS